MKKTPHRIFRFILRLILNIIAQVEMSGFEHLPPEQGYVIAANHIGRLDAALAYYVLDRPDIIMVVAEKYEKYAFFRWLVRITNGMFIDRYNADIASIRATLRRLNQGQILTITPEGTRSKSGNLIEAKPGGSTWPGRRACRSCRWPFRVRGCRRQRPPQAFQTPAY